jgi:hypothetical protein
MNLFDLSRIWDWKACFLELKNYVAATAAMRADLERWQSDIEAASEEIGRGGADGADAYMSKQRLQMQLQHTQADLTGRKNAEPDLEAFEATFQAVSGGMTAAQFVNIAENVANRGELTALVKSRNVDEFTRCVCLLTTNGYINYMNQ